MNKKKIERNKIKRFFLLQKCFVLNELSGSYLLGLLFVYYSLTPSLLPRNFLRQGLLSGLVFSIGYLLWIIFIALWRYLELPNLKANWQKIIKKSALIILLSMNFYALYQWPKWQNNIWRLMGQSKDVALNYKIFYALIIALVVIFILFIFGCLVRRFFRVIRLKVYKLMPRRFADFLGFLLAGLVFLGLINGLIIKNAFRVIDYGAKQVNNYLNGSQQQPINAWQTGSQASLISWSGLGSWGRSFIKSGPTKEDISIINDSQTTKNPLRIYVGLNNGNNIESRVNLALEEMKRVRAFQRKVLVIAIPTGTGWMDPRSMDSLEYIGNGDTAIVGVQYSYLSSPATVLFYNERAGETAKALFEKVYDYWVTLPTENRPKLYLFGISLGSYGSEQSVQLYKIIYNPIDGALWTGPPFINSLHNKIVNNRQPGSPVWKPEYGDGTLVRFTTGQGDLQPFKKVANHQIKIIYLQHPNDPLVFFSKDLFFKKPAWLSTERSSLITKNFRWRPVVTALQILFDFTASVEGVPIGHGHNYGWDGYIDSWAELLEAKNWTPRKTEELKKILQEKELAPGHVSIGSNPLN